jgi:hypothetical protein
MFFLTILLKLRIEYRDLYNVLEKCSIYAKKLVILAIIDQILTVSPKICLNSGFSVLGLITFKPGLEF